MDRKKWLRSMGATALALTLTGAVVAQQTGTQGSGNTQGSGATQPPSATQPSGTTRNSGNMQGTSSSASGNMQGSNASGMSGSSMLSSGDRKFIMEAAQGGMAEVELGKLAQQKSTNDEVKRLAGMIVEGHEKANAELMQIASQKGVTPPAELTGKHRSMKTRMEGMSAEQFDRAYLQGQLSDHRKTISLFQREINSGRDAEVKAFASKYLPDIQGHTQEIEKVNMSMRSGGSRMTNDASRGMSGSDSTTGNSGSRSGSGTRTGSGTTGSGTTGSGTTGSGTTPPPR